MRYAQKHPTEQTSLTLHDLEILVQNTRDILEINADIIKKGAEEMCIPTEEYNKVVRDHEEATALVERLETLLEHGSY